MNIEQLKFINAFRQIANEVCPKYNLLAIEAIVAQACVESDYGKSQLSAKYHNYFGMKCGGSYKGASVNMKTKEEYKPGVVTTIKDNFRAYSSMREGIEGYCQFIVGYKRYRNLLGVKDYATYIQRLKDDGWATSSSYVNSLMKVAKQLTPDNRPNTQPEMYTVGRTYTVVASSLNVRTAPSTAGVYIKTYPKGTRCTCKEIRKQNDDIWIRTPSGWCAAYYKGKKYIV